MSMRTFRFLILLLITSFAAHSQTLTISSSGETGATGTNWSISGGTLTVTDAANIQASVIEMAHCSYEYWEAMVHPEK